ncbi:MAG: T6SS component TssM (IcmF/VasK) [Nitrospira sp.]|jgi:type VI secretion system protein ImpL|nr:MAG: T6SS component TssM (IcmF/VasK) [Nitrospira sp.]
MRAIKNMALRVTGALTRAFGQARSYARRHPRPVVFWSVLILFVLLLSLGEYVGLERLETRVVTGLALFVTYGLYQAITAYREEKRAGLLEASLKKQALDQVSRTRPDRQAQVEAIKTEFEQAIASLKTSDFGHKALSVLPWYLLIGPPASGKSTALMNSGLQMTYPREQGKGVRGLGGTRNCDWWFTNEAVFLDTAGRYSSGDDDREEWLALLDSLKEQRRKDALNGVLIVVSLPDLLVAKEKEIEWHAENIRARLEELIERLGVVFPVYLIFTKCDLLRGFVEFCDNLSHAAREEQVWGCTFPALLPPADTPQRRFETAFDELLHALQARRHARLLSLLGSKKVQDIFCFPLHLSLAKQNLTHFVDRLFQPYQFLDSPLFRGFYLSSGTQEGIPLDEVVNAVNRRAGLPESVGLPAAEPREKSPYFIKHLFTGIVIPDQGLVRPSTAEQHRLRRRRYLLAAGTTMAVVVCVSAAVYSFLLNRAVTQQLGADAEQSYHSIVGEARPFIDGVQDKAFRRFRDSVQVLQDDKEEGAPLVRRWGMNREASVYGPARDLFVALFYRLYRDQTRKQVEETLRAFAADPATPPPGRDSDFYYSYLKTYLLLSSTSEEAEPAHLDRPFLAEWLQRIWQDILLSHYGSKAATQEIGREVEQQIDLYGRLLDRRQVPFSRDQGLVSAARVALQRLPYPERIYARIQREMMKQYKPDVVTLASLLQSQKTSLLQSSYEIPGFFTPKFDNGLFIKVRDRVLDQAYTDSWVLPVPQDPRVEVEQTIHKLYRDNYIRHWSQFLASVKMRPASTREDAITFLQGLTQENSVLVALLKAVDEHTSFSKLSDFVCDVSRGWIGRNVSPHPVSEAFKSLHEFVVSCPEGQGAPLKQYMQELQQLRDALTRTAEGGQASPEQFQAEHRLAALTDRLDQRIKVPLLLEPVHMVDVEKRRELSRDCAQAIGELYPFNPGTSEEATIPNLVGFFHPQTGRLPTFYKSKVRPLSADDRQEGAGSTGQVPGTALQQGSRQAKTISDALFPLGSQEPKVPFEMKAFATGGVGLSEIHLVIEGQELTYRMEPESYVPFQWTGRTDERGALLQIVVGADEARRKSYTKQYEGRWGLFRMLQEGRPVPISSTEFRLSWNFPTDGGEPVVVRFNLKAEYVKHPFAPGFFASFHCP